ncbi:MAG TPA: helix-turn-helix domain-containing protein [Candidatus Saccharimonadales bacterium]
MERSAVRTYFAKLGLEPEIADLYLALYAHGPQSISSLSRISGVERTRIYRLIDQLLDSNLVELATQNKRGIVKAAPVSNLRILINRREEELKNLTDELELIEQALSHNSLSHGQIRIQLFSTPDGMRHMVANEAQSKDEVVTVAKDTYSCHVYDDVVAYHFACYGFEIHNAAIAADMHALIARQA